MNSKNVYRTYGGTITKFIEQTCEIDMKTFMNRSRIVCMIKQLVDYKS